MVIKLFLFLSVLVGHARSEGVWCWPGYYGREGCYFCEAGWYQPYAGFFEQRVDCMLCPLGTYNPYVVIANCIPCDMGSFNVGLGNTAQSPCPNGQYNDRTGMTTCWNCPAGYYCQQNQFYQNIGCYVPKICDYGTYSTGGESACHSCTSYSQWSPQGSAVCYTCTTACPPGQYVVNFCWHTDLQCQPCPAGSYTTNTYTSICTPCPTGGYCPGGTNYYGSCTNAPTNSHYLGSGTTQTNCAWLCNANYYQATAGQCTICPYGYSRSDGASADATCTPCTRDAILSTGGQCSAGQYVTLTAGTCSKAGCATCSNAPANYYYTTTDDGSYFYTASIQQQGICFYSSCPACPTGTYRTGCSGTASAGSCAACTALVGLTYFSTGCTTAACASCTLGNYNNACPVSGGTSAGACSPCTAIPNGQFATITAAVSGPTACPFTCNAGYYPSGYSCAKCTTSLTCANGQYRPICSTADNQACQACQPTDGGGGKPATGAGWGPSADAYGGPACRWWCSTNYYLSGSTCALCSTSATVCDPGNQVDRSACAAGPGNNTQPTCATCGAVTANAFYINAAPTYDCQWTCNSGYWAATTKTKPCNLWTSPVPTCNAGFYPLASATSDYACTTCTTPTQPLSAYVTYSTWLTTNNCAWTCKAGTFLDSAHSNQCWYCGGGTYKSITGTGACTACGAGTYQPNSATPATACSTPPANGYVTGTGATDFSCNLGNQKIGLICSPCTAIANSASVTWNQDACTISALSCVQGFYRTATGPACVSCPAITQAATISATPASSAATSKCGNYPTAAGTGTCSDAADEQNIGCPAIVTCNAGYYPHKVTSASTQSVSSSCVQCTQISCGTGQHVAQCIGDGLSQANTCAACDATGLTTGWALASGCVKVCDMGYYLSGATCVLCGKGYYKPGIGSDASCTPCPAGSFSGNTGSLACTLCTSGTSAGSAGLSICPACGPGLNSPFGATTCNAAYDLFAIVTDLGTSGCRLRKVVSGSSSCTITTIPGITACADGMAVSPLGDYFLYDNSKKAVIYKYSYVTSTSTLVAGIYEDGYNFRDGYLGTSELNYYDMPTTISPDGGYALIVSSNMKYAIRRLNLNTNYLDTVTGTSYGYADGTGGGILLISPTDCEISLDGTFALITEYANRVRRLDLTTNPFTSSTIGGDSSNAYVEAVTMDGTGTNAKFFNPVSIAISPDNFWAFVSEAGNSAAIRMIQLQSKIITTLVSGLNKPSDLYVSPFRDYLLIVEYGNNRLLKIPFANGCIGNYPGATIVYAGSGNAAEVDGTGTQASFNMPAAMDNWRCGLSGYGAVSASNLCGQCPAGTYSYVGGICYACPPGSANAAAGSSACTPCALNFFSGSNATACTSCPTGSVTTGMSFTACVAAPGYTQTLTSNLPMSTAFASSVFSGYPASYAKDGNTGGSNSYCSSQPTAGNWWGVDFSTPRTVNGGTVWSRSDCCPDRVNDFQIWVGPTLLAAGAAWSSNGLTLCFTDFNHTQGFASGASQSFVCAFPIVGQYAYLYRQTTDYLNFAEITFSELVFTACPIGTYMAGTGNVMLPYPTQLTYAGMIFAYLTMYGGFPAYFDGVNYLYNYANYDQWVYGIYGLGNANCNPGPATPSLDGLLWESSNVKYGCFSCAAGSYNSQTSQSACIPCPLDCYCKVGSTIPTACPTSTPYTTAIGQISASACQAHLYAPCRVGFFLDTINSYCSPCPFAAYCPGAPSNSITACPPASTGSWYSAPLSSTVAACVYQAGGGSPTCPSFTTGTTVTNVLQCRAVGGYYYIAGYHTQGNICPGGYYCPAGSLLPIACPSPATACTTSGYTQIANACPSGVSAILAACTPCTNGKPTNAAYTTAGLCDFCCNAGYLRVGDTTCSLLLDSSSCANTQYMPTPPSTRCTTVSVQACVDCPGAVAPATFASQSYRNSNAPSMTGITACVYVCPLGYTKDANNLCTACAQGKYQANLYDATCTTCPFGMFMPNAAASVCWSCGIYGWPNAAQTQCVCVGGAYSGLAGDGKPTCLACDKGSVTVTVGQCYTCPPGKVCTPNTDSTTSTTTTCAAINGNMIKASAGATCTTCPAGSVPNANHDACTPCAAGSYANAAQTLCVACGANSYSAAVGASSSSTCTACQAPLVSNAGSAVCVCAANYFKSGVAACTPCLTSCQAGATLIQTCPMGSTSDTSMCACNGNTMGDGISTSCATCPTGGSCACARGSYYNGATCVACRTGCPLPSVFSGVCVKGTTGQDATVCICPVGTYWRDNVRGCVKCRTCDPNATPSVTCVAGSTQDTAQCLCNTNYVGNGFTCTLCPTCLANQVLSTACATTVKNPNDIKCIPK